MISILAYIFSIIPVIFVRASHTTSSISHDNSRLFLFVFLERSGEIVLNPSLYHHGSNEFLPFQLSFSLEL